MAPRENIQSTCGKVLILHGRSPSICGLANAQLFFKDKISIQRKMLPTLQFECPLESEILNKLKKKKKKKITLNNLPTK